MAIYKTKTPTKDGRSYFFRIKYKDILGEIHDYNSQKFKTKKEAENEEAIYRIKVANQETHTSSATFKQIFSEYLVYKSKYIKKQSVGKIENQLKHFDCIKGKKVNDFNLQNYKQLVNKLENEKLAISYKNKLLTLFKSIINYSNKYYNTSTSILKFVELFKQTEIKKEMDFYTYDEFKQFISVVDDLEWNTFFSLLYFMGLRQGEAQALNWNDINFEKKELSITKTLTTKIKGEEYSISTPKTKNSIRTLPIPDIVLNGLKSMNNNAKKYKNYKEKWFVFGNSYPFPETTIQKRKNNYCKQAKLKQIRIHDFRHSCASFLINKGASIVLVSKYLGHSNITMTLNTYTHMYKNELEDIAKMINNI